MRRPVVRALMLAVGVGVFLWHLVLAVAGVVVLRWLVQSTTDLATTVLIVVGLTIVLALISYRYAPAQVLASANARPIRRAGAPWLFERLDRATAEMDVAMPDLQVADLGQPNAFALGGPGWGVVVVDRSLVRLLGPDELEAILVHELAHLESYDGLVKTLGFSVLRSLVGLVLLALFPVTTLVRGVARAVAWARGNPTRWGETITGRIHRAVEGGVLAVSLLLTLPLLALSRQREFAADARAAEVTGNPVAMARALYRIERATNPGWGLLSTLYVRGDEDAPLTNLLSTHPPTQERIDRLRELAEEAAGVRRIEIRS